MTRSTDANQAQIVRALRAMGCSVESLHRVGRGVPDLLVGWRARNVLLEVKDGNKPPGQRKLNPTQRQWHEWWRGQVCVVESVEDAVRVVQDVCG